MKIPFYILGLLLRYGPQHGYSLMQIIEERISDFAKIKLPTIYYHLDKLKEKGYIAETVDKEGNRPEKLVFTITETGKKYFDLLLEKQLKEMYSAEFPLDGILYFSEKIDNEKLKKELLNKKKHIADKLKILHSHKKNTLANIHPLGYFNAEAIFDHHICHFEAELVWLEKTLKGLPK